MSTQQATSVTPVTRISLSFVLDRFRSWITSRKSEADTWYNSTAYDAYSARKQVIQDVQKLSSALYVPSY